jgi:hypothetical protein
MIKNFEEFNKAKVDFIYGVSTDKGNATLDSCEITTHNGQGKFFDCNIAILISYIVCIACNTI